MPRSARRTHAHPLAHRSMSRNPAAPSSRSRSHEITSGGDAGFHHHFIWRHALQFVVTQHAHRREHRGTRPQFSASAAISNSMPRRWPALFVERRDWLGWRDQCPGNRFALVFSNHRPTPLLPAGNATRMRGSVPERSSRCAATGPSRRKLLMLRPSSMRKANARAPGGAMASSALAMAEIASSPNRSDRKFMAAGVCWRRASIRYRRARTPL